MVPYEILTASQWVHGFYLKKCRAAMEHYADIGACGISRDAAGYLAPQSLRNVLCPLPAKIDRKKVKKTE